MAEREEAELIALTVLGCGAAYAPDICALVMKTSESGNVAFAVDRQIILALRKTLLEIEQFLSRQTGRAWRKYQRLAPGFPGQSEDIRMDR